MVAAGELGRLVAIHGAYIQDWLTLPIDADGQKQAEWRTDPARAGQSAVLADIGVHAFNLACFISGCEAEEVAADCSPPCPDGGSTTTPMCWCAGSGGARGTILASQTSPGHYNDLSVRIYGDKAGLEWAGTRPEELRFTPLWRGDAHAGARRPRLDGREPRVSRACRPRIPKAISRPSPISTATPPRSSARIGRARPDRCRARGFRARCRGRRARREVRRRGR